MPWLIFWCCGWIFFFVCFLSPRLSMLLSAAVISFCRSWVFFSLSFFRNSIFFNSAIKCSSSSTYDVRIQSLNSYTVSSLTCCHIDWKLCITSDFLLLQFNTVDGLIFVGYQFSWSSWRVQSTNFRTHKLVIFCMNYEGKYYGHEFWTQRMCHFRSIHENWYPRKYSHPQY